MARGEDDSGADGGNLASQEVSRNVVCDRDGEVCLTELHRCDCLIAVACEDAQLHMLHPLESAQCIAQEIQEGRRMLCFL